MRQSLNLFSVAPVDRRGRMQVHPERVHVHVQLFRPTRRRGLWAHRRKAPARAVEQQRYLPRQTRGERPRARAYYLRARDFDARGTQEGIKAGHGAQLGLLRLGEYGVQGSPAANAAIAALSQALRDDDSAAGPTAQALARWQADPAAGPFDVADP